MSSRRRLMISASSSGKGPLYIYTGVDTAMRLQLVGKTLVCRSSGGAGTHDELREWDSPPLHFGRAACYFRFRDPGCPDDDIVANAAELFTEVWELGQPLNLGFKPSRIASVDLLGSGRDWVSCGEAGGNCWIMWSDDAITVNDDDGASSMYCFRVNFE